MFGLARILALADIIFSFIEGLLALRIVLKFFDANPLTPFVSWVYQTSRPLLTPFEGIFPSATTRGGFVLEVSALFALLAYAFLGYIIHDAMQELVNTKIDTKNSREK